ncbi:MAG: hypothetical protein SGPRY_013856, partial [Prymnesium sp.]
MAGGEEMEESQSAAVVQIANREASRAEGGEERREEGGEEGGGERREKEEEAAAVGEGLRAEGVGEEVGGEKRVGEEGAVGETEVVIEAEKREEFMGGGLSPKGEEREREGEVAGGEEEAAALIQAAESTAPGDEPSGGEKEWGEGEVSPAQRAIKIERVGEEYKVRIFSPSAVSPPPSPIALLTTGPHSPSLWQVEPYTDVSNVTAVTAEGGTEVAVEGDREVTTERGREVTAEGGREIKAEGRGEVTAEGGRGGEGGEEVSGRWDVQLCPGTDGWEVKLRRSRPSHSDGEGTAATAMRAEGEEVGEGGGTASGGEETASTAPRKRVLIRRGPDGWQVKIVPGLSSPGASDVTAETAASKPELSSEADASRKRSGGASVEVREMCGGAGEQLVRTDEEVRLEESDEDKR